MAAPNLIRCPACGGEVHAVAGRCKHCKEDLVTWRARLALGHQPQPRPPTQQPRPATTQPRPPTQQPVPQQPPQQPAQRPPTAQPVARQRPPTAGPPEHANGSKPPLAVGRVAFESAPRAQAAWWKRWPAWVAAAAIFLLGLSAGMLIERSRQSSSPKAAEASSGDGDFSGPVGLGMPTDPLPDKKAAPADRLSQTAPVSAFIDELVEVSCDKIISCDVLPNQSKSLCKSMFDDFRDPDLTDKVSRGRCEFDVRSANRCLRQIESVDCSKVSLDPTDITTLLSGTLVACQRSVTCR